MEYEELTEKIIGCAFKVHNELKFGFLESVYENALVIELQQLGLKCSQQKPINVYYGDKSVGTFVTDIIVEDMVILELKSIRAISKEHEVQLVNYLTATRKPIGLILNFGPNGVDVKRKIRFLPNEWKKRM